MEHLIQLRSKGREEAHGEVHAAEFLSLPT